jgi:MtN3 and saliva related transmembrane protein
MIGTIATVLTTTSILPQLYKTFKTKHADHLSLIQMLGLYVGIACWLVYGIQISCVTVIVANSISLVLQTFMLIMKIKYTEWE